MGRNSKSSSWKVLESLVPSGKFPFSFSLFNITLLLSVDLVNDVELLIVVIFAIVLIPNLLKRGITS